MRKKRTAGGHYADDLDRPCQNGKIGYHAAADGGAGGEQPADPAGAGARLPSGGGGRVQRLRRYRQPSCRGAEFSAAGRAGAKHHRRHRGCDAGQRRQAADPPAGAAGNGPPDDRIPETLAKGGLSGTDAGAVRRTAKLRGDPGDPVPAGAGHRRRHPRQADGSESALRRL